jgi:hypothetical protein
MTCSRLIAVTRTTQDRCEGLGRPRHGSPRRPARPPQRWAAAPPRPQPPGRRRGRLRRPGRGDGLVGCLDSRLGAILGINGRGQGVVAGLLGLVRRGCLAAYGGGLDVQPPAVEVTDDLVHERGGANSCTAVSIRRCTKPAPIASAAGRARCGPGTPAAPDVAAGCPFDGPPGVDNGRGLRCRADARTPRPSRPPTLDAPPVSTIDSAGPPRGPQHAYFDSLPLAS